MSADIPVDFPWQKKKLRAGESFLSYIDEGRGQPFVFLHGNPASSYLWRKIIPHILPYGRCIAPDLPGTGSSGRPDISYRFSDHEHYLEEFLENLGLQSMFLVVHDWGSALGLNYASHHPDKINGIVLMEAMVRPWRWTDMPLLYRLGFSMLRTPILGEFMVYRLNVFLNVIMPGLTLRKLQAGEKKQYKTPFKKIRSRKPMLIWPRDIPINGKPRDTQRVFEHISSFIQETSIPKLLLYAEPGAILNKPAVSWCRQNMKNLKTVYLGKGYHFLQEDYPHRIGREITEWYREI